MSKKTLWDHNMRELQDTARARGMHGYTRLRKGQLIDRLAVWLRIYQAAIQRGCAMGAARELASQATASAR